MMDSIDQHSFEINVEQLTFGTYQAKVLQGQLTALQQYQLIADSEMTAQELNT